MFMYYLIGGAGNGNFGDELIVKEWIEFLHGEGEREIVFDGNYAKISRELFGEIYPTVTFVDDISKLKRAGPDAFYASLVRGLTFYANGGFSRYPHLAPGAARLAAARTLHLHGGGYINTIWPRNAFLIGFAAATKREFGCRLIGTGLGLLPAADAPERFRAPLREALEAFDLLEVRDRWSYDYLRKVTPSPRILLGLDDSFLMHCSQTVPSATDAPRTLHISYFSSADRFELVLDAATSPEAARFDRVLFWNCTNQDAQCYERLAEACPRAESVHWRDLVRGPLPVAPGDFMITARFHPHLLAARHGAHGICRTDRGYYDVKQGSVTDLGSPFAALSERIELGDAPEFSAMVAFDEERVASKRKLAAWVCRDQGWSPRRVPAGRHGGVRPDMRVPVS